MRRALVALAALTLGLFLIGRATWWISEGWIQGEAPVAAAVQLQPALLQEVLDASLLPAVLGRAQLLEAEAGEEVDPQGAWMARSSRYQLEPGEDPEAIASRLRGLALDALPGAEVYITPRDDLEVSVRFYAGKRLVHHLTLVPTLEEAPQRGGRPALVALVILGLGEDARLDQRVLASRFPLSVGIVPFSPFALRMSREAARNHKEILVELPESVTTVARSSEAVLAVPGATGVVLRGPPVALPVELLVTRSMVLFDAVGDAEGVALRAAREQGVPLVRRHDALEGDLMARLNRAHHMARKLGGVVLVIDADDDGLGQVLAWLAEAEKRDLRPAYLTEVAGLSPR